MRSFFWSFVLCAVAGGVFPSPVFARTPDDLFFEDQWYLKTIGAPAAWETTTGSEEVVVAILDTGFDESHPDLRQNLWVNSGEIAGNEVDDDGNGFVDDVHGWSFVEDWGRARPPKTNTYDESAISHATMIAGIIGATTQNTQGIAGINWKVKLMNVRILDNQGLGTSESVRRGIAYAVDNGADIINLSFTGFDRDPLMSQEIERANREGVLLVAAVGNSRPAGIDLDDQPIYPACDGHGTPDNGIIGVAAANKQDVLSVFSNYGKTCTDIAAPGEDILGAVFQDDDWEPFADGYYQEGWSGTSMAAPMVTGAAALLRAQFPSLRPDQIKNVLRLSADPLHVSGIAAGKAGAGRLNIATALSLAQTLYPPEARPGSLMKTACAEAASVNDPCRAVYYYGVEGARHAFSHERVFYSWFSDFSSVQTVSAAFLARLPLGKPVPYKPGSRLVKFQSVPTVYGVYACGELRPVPSESDARAWAGPNWNTRIDDISDAFFTHYRVSQSPADAAAAVVGSSLLQDQFSCLL